MFFMDVKKFYSTGEVSKLLSISRATVSRKFDAGIFQGKKNPITGDRFIDHESLLTFMKQYDIPVKDLEKIEKKYIILGTQDKHLQDLFNITFSEDNNIMIDTVFSGCEALIMCLKNTPDLFVIDDELSDISTIEVIKSLKHQDDRHNMKIICCLNTFHQDKMNEFGADVYFAKDTLDENELLREISFLLGIPRRDQTSYSTFDHRRLWPRIYLKLPANFELFLVNMPNIREMGNATVENISLGGAFMSRINLEKGNIPCAQFRLDLAIDHPPLENWQAECKAVRLQTNGSITAGIQFVNISQENKNKISDIGVIAV